MNKTYQQIIEARKKGARKLSDYGFNAHQQEIALAIKHETLWEIGGYENMLSDEGDYAVKVPTAETLAKIIYQRIVSGDFGDVETYFMISEHKHARFLTKEFLEGVCQWYSEYAIKTFNDYGRKYETYSF